MQFPTEKNKVLALAHTANIGFQTNPEAFPAPPADLAVMKTAMTDYEAKRTQIVAAEAAVKSLYSEESTLFEEISNGTKMNLKYAESVANGDAAKLALVGWGNPSAPVALQTPGQCRALEIIGQGDGWVQIDWKEPSGGGKVASYIVQRSEDGVNFTQAKAETVSESILLNQPKGKSLIYQVVAINKTGTGTASNTISITL